MTFRIILLIAPVLLLGACRSQIAIPVTYPAPVDVPRVVEKIVFLDNTSLNDTRKPFLGGIFSGKTPKNKRQTLEALYRGFGQSLGNAQRYQWSLSSAKRIRKNESQVDWQRVQEICEAQNAQMLVVLEWFDTSAPGGGAALSKVAGTGGYLLSSQTVFSIYFPLERYAIEFQEFQDDIASGASPSLDPISLVADLSHEQRLIRELGYRSGRRIAEYFFPLTVFENRNVWGNTPRLRRNQRLLRSGNWELAAEQAAQFLPQKRVAENERLLLHRAVAAEAAGRLDKAIKYAEQAALLRSNPLANDYLLYLNERLEQEKRLQWQEEQAGR